MCFMQQGIKSDEFQLIMSLFASYLILYHIDTQRHTAHSGTTRLIHPYKYILIPPVMCL